VNKKSSKVSSSKLGFACGFKAWKFPSCSKRGLIRIKLIEASRSYKITSVNIKLIETSFSKRGLIEVSFMFKAWLYKNKAN